jgi:hypothetical protein
MEKVIIGAIDCYRHDYWKVSIQLLCDLNIIDAISEYSFTGTGNTPLDEKGFAYLEIDTDCGVFDKAMKHYDKQYQLDFDTLQEEFDENYDDYEEWLDELQGWSTDTLRSEGYAWNSVPEDLTNILNNNNSDDEEEDYD